MVTALTAAGIVGLSQPSATATAVEWLDPTFGTSGLTTVPGEGFQWYTSEPDPAGRTYLVSGTFDPGTEPDFIFSNALRVRRVLPNGAIDPDFGAPLFASGSSADHTYVEFRKIFPHPDGSVTLVYGTQGGTDIFLKQYTTTGEPDATFGSGGVAVVSFPGSDSTGVSEAIQRPGGGYLLRVRSSTFTPSFVTHYYVAGVTAQGTLDTTWAPGAATPGILEPPHQNQSNWDYVLLARPGGGYAISGQANWFDGASHSAPALIGLTETGALDPAWAAGSPVEPGVLPIDGGGSSFGAAQAVLDGSSMVVSGSISDMGGPVFVSHPRLVRVTAAGAVDATFGTDGHVDLPEGFFGTLNVIGGAYYLSGSIYDTDAGTSALAVAKVLSSGLDPSFGSGGIATSAPATTCETSADQVFVTGTFLITSGFGCDGTPVYTRFSLSGVLDTSYGDGGQVAVDRAFGSSVSGSLSFQQLDGRIVGIGQAWASDPADVDLVIYRLASSGPVGQPAGSFVALPPSRILDTRSANGVPGTSPVPGQGLVDLQVTGRGGVPASGVGAVVLNVTVAGATWEGFVTAYPTGQPRPTASSLNFAAGQVVPNLVTVKIGTAGKVTLFNGQFAPDKTVHIIADVAGYYLDGTATVPGAYTPLTPARLLDTRSANGVPGTSPVPGQGSIDLQVTGRGGVPVAGVGAVVLNVTVTAPTWEGFVTVYATGQPRPMASNLNFAAGKTVPNAVTVKVGDGGKVTLFNGQFAPDKTAHIIADVAGYYLGGEATARGTFVALPAPVRVIDTRHPEIGGYPGRVAAGEEIELIFNQVMCSTGGGGAVAAPAAGGRSAQGPGPCPPGMSTALPLWWVSAAVMNVTVTQPTWDGSVVVYPGGTSPPLASNLNFVPGLTVPNLAIGKLSDGPDNVVKFRNNAIQGTVHIVVDVSGFFNL